MTNEKETQCGFGSALAFIVLVTRFAKWQDGGQRLKRSEDFGAAATNERGVVPPRDSKRRTREEDCRQAGPQGAQQDVEHK